MYKTRLKSGDTVKVISGKDKGKEGKILTVDRKNGKVIVEGVNMVTKHTKPSAANGQGGIVHQESALNASKVMYVHKGKPTRLGVKVVKEDRNGRTKNVRYRVAKSTGEVID
ncbi:50S ribosomal protein L24 [Vallitalea sp.]|uniref:50S ribosomal protein L24 n=1 Tax=Vallitalea sp. TaxID=1882829 RepID=UPI0025D34A52|nr:50S ribosomal protein L24 [Vallitalea sp.]MCT4686286.1 50S ribosomal protein L24 [Vallitalea sp.]